MAKRFTQETKEKAKAMRASGMSYVAIAKEFGCTAPCARYWCDTQARINGGGRAELGWKRISSEQGYYNHKEGLKRCGQLASDLMPGEAEAIIAIYSTAKQLSDSSGYPHEVDHIVPVKDGGEHRIWNLRVVPRYMNRTGAPKKN